VSKRKFEKIALIIEERIDTGKYPPNFKLPTHKALSVDLNTTPATVSKAYNLLIDKKKIESFVGRGTFVCGRSLLNKAILPTDHHGEINLSILQPSLLDNVPHLSVAMKVCANSLTAELIGYTEKSGHHQHRQAGVLWAERYGLNCGNVENTVLVDGAQNALALVIMALTKPGDVIAVEELTYPGILAIASLYRRTIVPIAMDEQGMIPDELDKTIREYNPVLVIVIPSHQNPTGITMPEDRRKVIATVIKSSSCWLLEDDIYGFLNPTVIPAITNWIPDKGIHITSLSKAISPALRCGFLRVPASCLSLLQSHIRTNIWISSPLNYAVATYLIENGDAFNMAEKQRCIAVHRQLITQKWLSMNSQEMTGFHLWLSLPHFWSGERFVMEAKNRNVIVSSGSYFDTKGVDPRHVRVSLMSVANDGQLEKGLRILSELIQSDGNTLIPF